MANSILGIMIKDLTIKQADELLPEDDLIIESDEEKPVTKRTKLAYIMEFLRSKLGLGQSDISKFGDGTLTGCVKDLYEKMLPETISNQYSYVAVNVTGNHIITSEIPCPFADFYDFFGTEYETAFTFLAPENSTIKASFGMSVATTPGGFCLFNGNNADAAYWFGTTTKREVYAVLWRATKKSN